MRFADPGLQTELQMWRSGSTLDERAMADNIWFEERVSAPRLAHFETIVCTPSTRGSLASRQRAYWENYVKSDQPDTFLTALSPARLVPGLLDTTQRIVRMETIRPTVLPTVGMTVDDLRDAHETGNAAVLDVFLDQWNQDRDGRPAFAAWKDEVREHVLCPDWADQMRDRFGLAHYNPSPDPIPVLLMEYPVADVLLAAERGGFEHAIVSPTVLDGGPWPWFFPSPVGLAYGRTMPLPPDRHRLMAEMLHVRMAYHRGHIARFGAIRRPLPPIDMRVLRNEHLAALQLEARRPDFGEEMP
jgi:hypothetical protein